MAELEHRAMFTATNQRTPAKVFACMILG